MAEKTVFNAKQLEVKLENVIIFYLMFNDEFRNDVIHILRPNFFKHPISTVFAEINELYLSNKKKITPVMIINNLQSKNIAVEKIEEVKMYFIDEIRGLDDDFDFDYLVEEVEGWAKEKAVELAVIDCINIMENKPENSYEMPELLVEALNVSLRKDIGLDYKNTLERRLDYYYNIRKNKLPFSMEKMNELTMGGFPRKSLNTFMGFPGIGKSLILCSLASDYLRDGHNVLYVTLEMSEELIGSRIDANLMNIKLSDMPKLSRTDIREKFEKIAGKIGDLKIVEFPTGSINATHIRGLIKDLKLKKAFVPDVVIVDYINLMNPARTIGKNSNSYMSIKVIAEELRGIMMENNAIGITVTQVNREGIDGKEVGLDKVSESTGLPMTVDFFCAVYQNDDQRQKGIYIMKILKSRYSKYVNFKFALGVDYDCMKIYQLEDTVEKELDRTGLNEIYETKEPMTQSSDGAKITSNRRKKKH